MFEELLPQQPGEESIPYDILEDKTEGYSGSDIRLLCKETAMQPLRRLMSQLEQSQDVVPEEGRLFTKSSRNTVAKIGLHRNIDSCFFYVDFSTISYFL